MSEALAEEFLPKDSVPELCLLGLGRRSCASAGAQSTPPPSDALSSTPLRVSTILRSLDRRCFKAASSYLSAFRPEPFYDGPGARKRPLDARCMRLGLGSQTGIVRDGRVYCRIALGSILFLFPISTPSLLPPIHPAPPSSPVSAFLCISQLASCPSACSESPGMALEFWALLASLLSLSLFLE